MYGGGGGGGNGGGGMMGGAPDELQVRRADSEQMDCLMGGPDPSEAAHARAMRRQAPR